MGWDIAAAMRESRRGTRGIALDTTPSPWKSMAVSHSQTWTLRAKKEAKTMLTGSDSTARIALMLPTPVFLFAVAHRYHGRTGLLGRKPTSMRNAGRFVSKSQRMPNINPRKPPRGYYVLTGKDLDMIFLGPYDEREAAEQDMQWSKRTGQWRYFQFQVRWLGTLEL